MHSPYSERYENFKLKKKIKAKIPDIPYPSSHTWMWADCDDTPLIDVWSVHLDFFIGGAPSVSIVTSSYVNVLPHYTGAGITYTFRENRGHSVKSGQCTG